MLGRALGNDGFHSRLKGAPSIDPLLAQPIVEACLAIPSWAWIAGGRDRALIRSALRGYVDDTLLARRSKGGPAGFVEQVFLANEAIVRDMLHDGVLRTSGIIDSIDDPAFPSKRGTPPLFRQQRLLALAAAEVWARQWH